MKRARLLSCFFVLLLSLFLLLSCSQDLSQDDSRQESSEEASQETEVITPSIRGTWYWMKNDKEYFVQLNQDGKGILHYWQDYGGGLTGYVNIEVVNWGYDAEAKKFSITVKGEIAGWYNVDYLTGSTMKLSKIKGQHDIGFGLTDSELKR